MRQYKIVIVLEYGELLAQARFMLAQRVDPTADSRHMLTQIQVEPFHEGRIDLPPLLGQHLLDGLPEPEPHTVAHADQTPTILLDPLCNSSSGKALHRGFGAGPCVCLCSGCTHR